MMDQVYFLTAPRVLTLRTTLKMLMKKCMPHHLSACSRKGPDPKTKLLWSRNETRGLTKKKNKVKVHEQGSREPGSLLTCGSTMCRSSWAHAASQARFYGLTTGVVDWQHFMARRTCP